MAWHCFARSACIETHTAINRHHWFMVAELGATCLEQELQSHPEQGTARVMTNPVKVVALLDWEQGIELMNVNNHHAYL